MNKVRIAVIQVGNMDILDQTADIYYYPQDITENELCEEIKLSQDYYDNIIIQLPLPPHIRQEVVVAAISKGGYIQCRDGLRMPC